MASSPETGSFSIKQHEKLSENMVPGQIVVEVPGFTTGESVSEGIKKGRISRLIAKLHDEEKHIVALGRPGKIVLYIGASVGLIGAVAGGVYLRSKKKNG